MKENDTIHIRIAQILRALEYIALIIILLSLAMKYIYIDGAVIGAKTGIGLSVLTPIAGVIAVLVISLRSRNFKFVVATLFILLIFVIAVMVSL